MLQIAEDKVTEDKETSCIERLLEGGVVCSGLNMVSRLAIQHPGVSVPAGRWGGSMAEIMMSLPLVIRVELIPQNWLKFYGHKILCIIYWIRTNSGKITGLLYNKILVILLYILPSTLIIYPIGQDYLPFNIPIIIEISVTSIDLGVKIIGFAFTP